MVNVTGRWGQMHTQGKFLLGNDIDLTEKLQKAARHVQILRKCVFRIEDWRCKLSDVGTNDIYIYFFTEDCNKVFVSELSWVKLGKYSEIIVEEVERHHQVERHHVI